MVLLGGRFFLGLRPQRGAHSGRAEGKRRTRAERTCAGAFKQDLKSHPEGTPSCNISPCRLIHACRNPRSLNFGTAKMWNDTSQANFKGVRLRGAMARIVV